MTQQRTVTVAAHEPDQDSESGLIERRESTWSDASGLGGGAHGKGTWLSTVANTLCTMVGGGVLAIPLAFEHASVCIGLFLVVASAALSTGTVYLLTASCDRESKFTLRRLLERAFPNASKDVIGRVVEGFIVVSSTSALIVYVKIIGSSLPPVIDDLAGKSGLWSHDVTWIVVACVICFPLACAKQLNDLFILSVLGFGAALYNIVMICVRFFDGSYRASGQESLVASDVEYFNLSSGILPALSIILGALMYQMNVPVLYQELQQRTPKRMVSTAVGAYALVATLYCSAGMLGYMTFGGAAITGSKSQGNILKLYRSDDVAMNIGRCLLCFHYICAFPIYAVVARRSFHVVVFGEPSVLLAHRVAEAFGLIVIVVVAAMFIPGIGIVMQFTGAIFGTTIAVSIPSLIYFRLFAQSTAARETALDDAEKYVQAHAADKRGHSQYAGSSSNPTALFHAFPGDDSRELESRASSVSELVGRTMMSFKRWPRLAKFSVVLSVLGVAETLFSVVVTIASLA